MLVRSLVRPEGWCVRGSRGRVGFKQGELHRREVGDEEYEISIKVESLIKIDRKIRNRIIGI